MDAGKLCVSLENLCVTVPVKQRGPSRKNSDRCEVTREGKNILDRDTLELKEVPMFDLRCRVINLASMGTSSSSTSSIRWG